MPNSIKNGHRECSARYFQIAGSERLSQSLPERYDPRRGGSGLADFQGSQREDASTLYVLKRCDLAALHFKGNISGLSDVDRARNVCQRRRIVWGNSHGICRRRCKNGGEVFELIHLFQFPFDQRALAQGRASTVIL